MITVPTVLKLACKIINGWNPGSVAGGDAGSITLPDSSLNIVISIKTSLRQEP
jgi:hypothetical protein